MYLLPQNHTLQGITSDCEDVEERESLCSVGGDVNRCNHYGKQHGNSSKN